MGNHSVFLSVLFVAVISLCSVDTAASAERKESPPTGLQLEVAASEDILWLAVGRHEKLDGQEERGQWLQRFAYQQAESAELTPTYKISPQVGKIACMTVTGENLHIFYADEKQQSTHYRYTPERSAREKQLPGRPIPRAVAGTIIDGRSCLWAVVDSATTDQVETAHQRRLAEQASETAPAETAPADLTKPNTQPSLFTRPENTFHLVQYCGRYWQPGFPAPKTYRDSERTWLCTMGGELHLLWQENARDLQINYACGSEEGWEQRSSISLKQPIAEGFATVTNARLFFVAALPDPDQDGYWRIQSWRWIKGQAEDKQDRWQQGKALQTAKEKTLTLSPGLGIGAFGDRFVVLARQDNKPTVGFWPTAGGSPARDFTEVPLAAEGGKQGFQRSVREMLVLFSVAVLLLLVWWRRQASFSIPVALPAGLTVTGSAKRAIAGLLDLLPAIILVTFLFYEPLSAYLQEVRNATSQEQFEALSKPTAILWASISFRLLYIAYCTLFELWMQASPGKRLLGCSVTTEQGERPHPYQIIIRNVTKMIELEPFLQIWPFMLIIFFTQNRQRLGDLIARTIVVEKQPVTQQPEEEHDSPDNPLDQDEP